MGSLDELYAATFKLAITIFVAAMLQQKLDDLHNDPFDAEIIAHLVISNG